MFYALFEIDRYDSLSVGEVTLEIDRDWILKKRANRAHNSWDELYWESSRVSRSAGYRNWAQGIQLFYQRDFIGLVQEMVSYKTENIV